MSIDVTQGALVANAAESITLKVGGTQIVLAPSGINFIGAVVELNSSSSGRATSGNLDAKIIDDNTQKTKTYGAIQNDVTASDSPALEIRCKYFFEQDLESLNGLIDAWLSGLDGK